MLEQSKETPMNEVIMILFKKLYLWALLSRLLSLFIGGENECTHIEKLKFTLQQLFRKPYQFKLK